MIHPPLNTPIQAQHLSHVYGGTISSRSTWLVVGSEKYIESWVNHTPSMDVYALRSWNESQVQTSRECTGIYLHLEPQIEWASIVPNLLAKDMCVVRHGLPIGTRLMDVYDMIPASYRSRLPKNESYGILMNRLSDQQTPTNPISRSKLATLMKACGWNYVSDLCTYRDFGHERDDIEERDFLCGLVWRDSLFIRTDPIWSVQQTMNCTLLWRIKSKKQVANGWIYTTLEGLQVGFRGDVSLEEYSDWTVLCTRHKEYVYSFIHSGLLSFGKFTS